MLLAHKWSAVVIHMTGHGWFHGCPHPDLMLGDFGSTGVPILTWCLKINHSWQCLYVILWWLIILLWSFFRNTQLKFNYIKVINFIIEQGKTLFTNTLLISSALYQQNNAHIHTYCYHLEGVCSLEIRQMGHHVLLLSHISVSLGYAGVIRIVECCTVWYLYIHQISIQFDAMVCCSL